MPLPLGADSLQVVSGPLPFAAALLAGLLVAGLALAFDTEARESWVLVTIGSVLGALVCIGAFSVVAHLLTKGGV